PPNHPATRLQDYSTTRLTDYRTTRLSDYPPMPQAYYQKWRPHNWNQVVGQEHVITTLHNAIAADRVAHAHLFAGPRGTGKTTTARLLAKAVNCLADDLAARPCNQCQHCQAINQGRFLDMIEIDAASNTSVDDVRDLRDKINFSPNRGRYKVYIIDEVHMLSTAAFNALLKTLEEPPDHALFVLATTEVHKIPATVLSRCQRHEFRNIPVADIITQLEKISDSENLQIEPDALKLIARQATGSLRDAISLLDQLASTAQEITLKTTQAVLGTATNQSVLKIIDALLAGDSASGLNLLHQTLDTGSDPRQFARQIVDYLRNILLVRMGNADQVDVPSETHIQMAQHAQSFETSQLLALIQAFNHAASDARNAWQPALPLEIAFIESLNLPPREKEPPTKTPAPQVRDPNPPSRGRVTPDVQPAPQQESAKPEPETDSLPQNILTNWNQILKFVGEQEPQAQALRVQALLKSSKPMGMKDNALVLGFSGGVIKSKMESGENIELFQRAIEKVLGKSIPVLCMLAKGGKLPPDIDQDGMVATALRDLGGEIVDIQ
ncbi:MAG: DNA polymerase III subunit gamma/tau, partial [Chloroflexota bacterium]|nr:DNA polymerase III subunit gamma/tau [Chloroflexota bacterium]